jgi:hypothetical protein
MIPRYFHASSWKFARPDYQTCRDKKDPEDDYNSVLGLWSASLVKGLNVYGNILYTYEILGSASILNVDVLEIENGQPEGYWHGLRSGFLLAGIDVVRAHHFQIVINYDVIVNWRPVKNIPPEFYESLWD